jgi:hypothetical protein
MRRLFFIIITVILLAGCGSREKEMPFFNQTDSGNCLQTNLKIVLEYYYPEREYSSEQLDDRTGRTQGKWTWTSQAMEFLIDEGLDAYYYSTTPYLNISKGGEAFILNYYGEEDGRIMIQHTNFDALYQSINTLNESARYKYEKLDFSDVEKMFNEGNTIIMLIDRNALTNPKQPYAGHFVTITSINSTHVVFHDTAGTPNRIAERTKFIEAWNAPGTDNDAIIIKGKI